MFSIDAVMSTGLVTLAPEATLADARSLMQEHRIHHLPVVDANNKLRGLLTLSDLLRASDSSLRDADERIHARDIRVGDVMVTEVATVSAAASLRQAALFLEKHRIGCLPVMDGETIVGIITDSDFVAVAINLLEQLEDSEPVEDSFDDADVA